MRASLAGKNRSANGASEAIDQDPRNLLALRSSVDLPQIAAVASEYHLTLLGLPVFAGSGHGRIGHLARVVTDKDVVFAISFRRGLRMSVEGFEQARQKGAYCIGITDTLLSPLAQLADICFIASAEAPPFGVSYVAPMALLNALAAACANVRRNQTLKLLREVDAEQRTGSRWFLHEPDEAL
jgi:DNA-binding MurR/RpiR family transcriptional regulator